MTAEPAYAPLRAAESAWVATPPQTCLNGCMRGSGDARGPVLTQGHALLCSGGVGSCTERLSNWLKGIPEFFGLLLWVREHGTVPADPDTVRTKQPDAPAPMRLEVTDLLDQRPGFGVLGIVHSWATVVREERNQPARCTCGHLGLGHPVGGHCTAKKCGCETYRAIAPKVKAEVALLVSNLPWIVEQEFVRELYDEIRQLNRTLTDTLGDYRAKPVGKCAVLIDVAVGNINDPATVKAPCGGALVMDKAGEGVRCCQCGNRVRADTGLRELGLIVGAMFGDNREQEAS